MKSGFGIKILGKEVIRLGEDKPAEAKALREKLRAMGLPATLSDEDWGVGAKERSKMIRSIPKHTSTGMTKGVSRPEYSPAKEVAKPGPAGDISKARFLEEVLAMGQALEKQVIDLLKVMPSEMEAYGKLTRMLDEISAFARKLKEKLVS